MSEASPASGFNEKRSLTMGLCAVLLWSTVATGFKLGLELLSVLQLLWLGTLISLVVFFLYGIFTNQLTPSKRLLSESFILGMINPVVYYIILFAAYDRLPAHIAQPLNYTWAITLALLAIPILGQKLSRNMIVGILLSYAGVFLLLTVAAPHAESSLSSLGVVLALLSTLLWATYWLLNTRWQHPPAALMFWSFSWASVILTGLVAIFDRFPDLSGNILFYGAWVGAIEMGVTFILWQSAMRTTQHVGRLGQLIFLSPFISLLIIGQVLEENISAYAYVSLLAIVAGIAISQRDPT